MFGNANVDLVIGEVDGWPAVGTEVMVERSEMRAGGSAGNTALALTGMGVAHRFVASTGSDPNGRWLMSQFDPASTDWLVHDGATTLTVGIVHRGGDRAFFTTPGHLQAARIADLLDRVEEAPAGGGVALLSGGFLMPDIEAGTAALLSRLRAKGWRSAIDPGWPPGGWSPARRGLARQWMAEADMALVNGEEAVAIAGTNDPEAAATALSATLPAGHLLVVKQGALGASAHVGGKRHFAPAPCVEVVDTVGAGDTFNAGLIASLARGQGIAEALRAGIAVASRAISTYPRRYAD